MSAELPVGFQETEVQRPSGRPDNGVHVPTLEDKVNGIAAVVGRIDDWAEREIDRRLEDEQRFTKIEGQLAAVQRAVQEVGSTVLARLDELLKTRCPTCPMASRPPT